jgi:spore germination cell wall hydrolase CwlJ-like protein
MFAYNEAKEVAVFVYANYENLRDITKGALYYHADYVNPRWKLEKTVVIGRHIFYKERDGI